MYARSGRIGYKTKDQAVVPVFLIDQALTHIAATFASLIVSLVSVVQRSVYMIRLSGPAI
jgi:hypothetical protein